MEGRNGVPSVQIHVTKSRLPSKQPRKHKHFLCSSQSLAHLVLVAPAGTAGRSSFRALLMGAQPSKPTDEQCAELEAVKSDAIKRAAAAIRQSDALLLMTGAGWSADSGLAVYADVACMPAYRERGLTYRDLCDPGWLEDEPALFLGFWGTCFNDYRNTVPHEGYQTVARWRDRFFRHTSAAARLRDAAGAPGAFFSFTSNVDAHAYQHFSPYEIRECHGNSETWQCAHRHCPGPPPVAESDAAANLDPKVVNGAEPLRWAAPASFRFRVDKETMLAPATGDPADPAPQTSSAQVASSEISSTLGGPSDAGELSDMAARSSSATKVARAFATNWPKCIGCGGAARPSILMFSDSQWHDDEEQSERWETWRKALVELARERGADFRLTIIEAGAGGNVTTVRNLSEDVLTVVREAGATATLVRINPELPLADRLENQPYTFSLLARGLDAVRAIDAAMERQLREGEDACADADLTPPVLLTVKAEEDRPARPTRTAAGETESEEEAKDDGTHSHRDPFEKWDRLKLKLDEGTRSLALQLQGMQGLSGSADPPRIDPVTMRSVYS
jgi:NAD-dependent SIR2 family protein deacetylase